LNFGIYLVFLLLTRRNVRCRTAAEMSVGEQDSLFSHAAHVGIWDAMPLGNSDDECQESGTE
jgi:hypothetical protein